MKMKTSSLNNSSQLMSKSKRNIVLDHDTIYDLYKEEFLNSCELILLENQNDFLDNFFNKLTLIIKSKYGEDIFEKSLTLYEIKKQCESEFIKEIYWPMRNACSSGLEQFSTSTKKNFLINFIPHCTYDQVPLHICGSKFIQINNNNIIYIVCTGCNKCYYSSCIKMFCPYCQKSFYSKLTEYDNDEIIYPATWEKYHCEKMHLNEQMSCINCGNLLWIKNNKLFCKNCKKCTKPKDIIWKCAICDEEFKSDVKIYNPLEFKSIEIAIRDALIYKKIVKPIDMPCNCLDQKEIDVFDFCHKENNLCNGVLYYCNMDDNDFLICSVCNSVCLLNNFKWHCPKCGKKFISKNVNYYLSDNKKNMRNSSSTKNKTYNKQMSMTKNNSYLKKIPENTRIVKDENNFNKNMKKNKKSLSIILDDKNFLQNYINKNHLNIVNNKNNKNNSINNNIQDIKLNTTSTVYSSTSNNHVIKEVLDTKSNEQLLNLKSKIINNQQNNNRREIIIKTNPISPANLKNNKTNKNSHEKIYVNTIYKNINNKNKYMKNNNSLNISINIGNNSVENSDKKFIKKLPRKFIKTNSNINFGQNISQRANLSLLNDYNNKSQIYIPKKHIQKTRCSSCIANSLYKNLINYTTNKFNISKNEFKNMSLIHNRTNNNWFSDKKHNISADEIEEEINLKKYRDFSGPKIYPPTNREIFKKLNTKNDLIKNDFYKTTRKKFLRNNDLNKTCSTAINDESIIKEKIIKFCDTNKNSKKNTLNKTLYNLKKDLIVKNSNKKNNIKSKYISKTNSTKVSEEDNNNRKRNNNLNNLYNQKLLLITTPNNNYNTNQFNQKEKHIYGNRMNTNFNSNLNTNISSAIKKKTNKYKSNNNKAKNTDIHCKTKVLDDNSISSNGIINNNNSEMINLKKEAIIENNNEEDDELKEFNFEDYKIITQIGQGTFGKIYLVQNKNGEPFSMKKIILSEELDVKSVIAEYQMCYKLKHENIVKILGVYNNKLDKTTYVVYVLMEIGMTDWDKEIRSYKEKNIDYSEQDLYEILKQITSALAFLQNKNISHRDIKPQNILVFKNKKYKMADFGEAKQLKCLSHSIINNSLRGTELYMSPLLFNGLRTGRVDVKHNLFKSDVYSFGLSLLYASTTDNKSLYDIRKFIDMNDVREYLKDILGKKYSTKFIELLSLMLEIHEKNRPDFVELEEIIEKSGM